ncbi:hypothetical protein ABKN59_010220 [Abortiporus biennis]
MGHITTKTGSWKFTYRSHNINNSMTLTSLVKIRDASKGELTGDTLKALLGEVPVPEGAEEGECLNWVINAVKHLSDAGVVTLSNSDGLRQEFATFCAGNKQYASRTRYPNLKASEYCTWSVVETVADARMILRLMFDDRTDLREKCNV